MGEAEVKGPTEAAARMRAAAAGSGLSLETLVLRGKPYEAIVIAAQTKEVDLIVLGSHGRIGISRLLMGSVAERVLGQSPCPVLVVKKR